MKLLHAFHQLPAVGLGDRPDLLGDPSLLRFVHTRRLTSDGRLRLCLLREGEVDLLTPLRDGATLSGLRDLILEGIWNKPWGHGLAEGVIPMNRVMSEIGG